MSKRKQHIVDEELCPTNWNFFFPCEREHRERHNGPKARMDGKFFHWVGHGQKSIGWCEAWQGCISAWQGRAQISWLKLYAIICMENLEDSQIYRQSNHDHNHCLVLSHCSIIHYGFPELNRFRVELTLFMELFNWGRLTFFCGELKYYIIRNVVLNREHTNSTIFTHL